MQFSGRVTSSSEDEALGLYEPLEPEDIYFEEATTAPELNDTPSE